jgi:hypothetical protein
MLAESPKLEQLLRQSAFYVICWVGFNFSGFKKGTLLTALNKELQVSSKDPSFLCERI